MVGTCHKPGKNLIPLYLNTHTHCTLGNLSFKFLNPCHCWTGFWKLWPYGYFIYNWLYFIGCVLLWACSPRHSYIEGRLNLLLVRFPEIIFNDVGLSISLCILNIYVKFVLKGLQLSGSCSTHKSFLGLSTSCFILVTYTVFKIVLALWNLMNLMFIVKKQSISKVSGST